MTPKLMSPDSTLRNWAPAAWEQGELLEGWGGGGFLELSLTLTCRVALGKFLLFIGCSFVLGEWANWTLSRSLKKTLVLWSMFLETIGVEQGRDPVGRNSALGQAQCHSFSLDAELRQACVLGSSMARPHDCLCACMERQKHPAHHDVKVNLDKVSKYSRIQSSA